MAESAHDPMGYTALRKPGPPSALSLEQVRQYDDDGYVFPLRAYSAAEAAGLRGHVESMEADRGQSMNGFGPLHLTKTFQRDIVCNPVILDAVQVRKTATHEVYVRLYADTS